MEPPKEKASEKQLKFLMSLEYKGKPPYSKDDASKLISKLLTMKQANELRDKVNFELSEDVVSITDENIGLYSYILTKCVESDIYEGAVIGMLYNNTKIDLRLKTNK